MTDKAKGNFSYGMQPYSVRDGLQDSAGAYASLAFSYAQKFESNASIKSTIGTVSTAFGGTITVVFEASDYVNALNSDSPGKQLAVEIAGTAGIFIGGSIVAAATSAVGVPVLAATALAGLAAYTGNQIAQYSTGWAIDYYSSIDTTGPNYSSGYMEGPWKNDGSFSSDPYNRFEFNRGEVYTGYTGDGTGYKTPKEQLSGPEKTEESPGYVYVGPGTLLEEITVSSSQGTSWGGLTNAWNGFVNWVGSIVDAVKSVFNGGVDAESTKPLIIDLGSTNVTSGDGLEFEARTNSHVFYDFDKDGFKERTAWVGPNEGIVIWDKNKNGIVDDGEMILTDFKPGSKTDMDALIKAGFDTDNDGKIEASETDGGTGDAGRLLIWQDKNVNAVFDNGDVVSSFGSVVSYIDIGNVNIDSQDKNNDGQVDADETVRFNDGSIIYGTYKVILADGSSKTTAYDMAFAHDDYGYKVDSSGDTIRH